MNDPSDVKPTLLSNWTRPPRPTRRGLLKAMGLAPALAPFVNVLDARAQTALPRRLVLWFTPHGSIYPKWRTSGPADNPVMGPILTPLAKHMKDLMILENVRISPDPIGGNHTKGLPLLWTARGIVSEGGWNMAPSVDQLIVDAIAPKTPYKSLEFGVRSGGANAGRRMIYRGPAKPLEPEQDPQKAFTRLFANFNPGADQAKIKALIADRSSVLDVVNKDLGIFRKKLAASEQFKLDAHMQAIRDVEVRINSATGTCSPPSLGAKADAQSGPATPMVWDQQMDVLAASLGCGLTNIASMQYRLGENDSSPYYTWLPGATIDHHTMTHEPSTNKAAWDHCEKIYTWYAEKFARFLDKLKAMPEGNGSVLDHTLVVWGSEVGNGSTHSSEKIPFVVAGGKANGVNSGRALRFGEISTEAAQHTRVLVSMAHYMGATQINTIGGEKDKGTGVLPGFFV